MQLPTRTLWLAAFPFAAILGFALAGRADSITAESIWDQNNAIQRAQQQVPANATVTSTRCTVVNVRTGNYRYICTLDYTTAPNSPNPTNGSSAPAP
jgi:hypothetical protein